MQISIRPRPRKAECHLFRFLGIIYEGLVSSPFIDGLLFIVSWRALYGGARWKRTRAALIRITRGAPPFERENQRPVIEHRAQ